MSDDLVERLRNPPVMSMCLSREHLYRMMAERMEEAAAEIKRLRGALAFYADPDNWRHMTEAEFRERHPGQDPSIAIRGGGVDIKAPAGRVLSPVDLDRHGHRARAALDGDGT